METLDSLSLSSRTHARTHTRTHAHTHALSSAQLGNAEYVTPPPPASDGGNDPYVTPPASARAGALWKAYEAEKDNIKQD